MRLGFYISAECFTWNYIKIKRSDVDIFRAFGLSFLKSLARRFTKPEKMKKPFLSRREQYSKAPTLRNRSLILAQDLDRLKKTPGNEEFRKIIHQAILDIQFLGRATKRDKRDRVIKALKSFACELDEIREETRLDRKDIKRVLKVLIRARLVVVTRRPNFHTEDGNHGSTMFYWREHYLEIIQK